MPRPKKDGRRLCCDIDPQVWERLKEYAEARGQTTTTAVERLLRAQLDYVDKVQNEWGDGRLLY